MKALVFKRPGSPFVVEEVDDPRPGPGQAVLKVCRCGICATDLVVTSGSGDEAYPNDSIIGHEYSGEVIEVAAGVTSLKIGDQVTSLPVSGCGHCAACAADDPQRCTGAERFRTSKAYAQYVLVAERSTVKLPAMVSPIDAALTEPLCCGLRGVYLSKMQPGARVLVMGAGPIGLATAYWARRLGAGRVVTTARSTRAAHVALAMGAHRFISATEALAAEAAEALGGAPDVVFECTGAVGMIARAVECVRPRGVVGVVGYCTKPDSFIPSKALMKEVSMTFALVYTRRDFEYSLEVMNAGDVAARAMITDTISMAEFPAVFEGLRGPNEQCKVLLDPWR